jgi:hypothetical protein
MAPGILVAQTWGKEPGMKFGLDRNEKGGKNHRTLINSLGKKRSTTEARRLTLGWRI